jgi:hypothetical protein
MYRSIKELRSDSELVVVAEGTGEIRPDAAADEWTPLANTTVVVKQALFGTKADKGHRISVFVEVSRDADGTLRSSKILAGKIYLLFLTPLHPDHPRTTSTPSPAAWWANTNRSLAESSGASMVKARTYRSAWTWNRPP